MIQTTLNPKSQCNSFSKDALRIASRGNNVHWIRTSPALFTPKITGNLTLKPNLLGRIKLHYGYDALPVLVKEFCSKTLFVNAITCSCLFVELQTSTWHFTNAECANLLAHLAIAANWMDKRRKSKEHCSVVVVLRDLPQYHHLASIYSDHILRWQSRENWRDLLGRGWNRKCTETDEKTQIGKRKSIV